MYMYVCMSVCLYVHYRNVCDLFLNDSHIICTLIGVVYCVHWIKVNLLVSKFATATKNGQACAQHYTQLREITSYEELSFFTRCILLSTLHSIFLFYWVFFTHFIYEGLVKLRWCIKNVALSFIPENIFKRRCVLFPLTNARFNMNLI